MLDILSSYSGIPVNQLQYLLSLPPQKLYQDRIYQDLIRQLDEALLHNTLHSVRAVYDAKLPGIKKRYGLQDTKMSGFTLGNWILGFLAYPERLPDLLNRHVNVPVSVITEVTPDLLALLEDVPHGGAEWQRALTIFVLPLLTRG